MDSSSGKATTAIVSDPVVDPVESLRAAALSTLKAKRRKPAGVVLPVKVKPPPPEQPRAPPSTDVVQLDYGLEEGKPGAPVAMAIDNIPPKDIANDMHRGEQSRSREEGEISDEEEPPPLRQSMTHSPVPGRKVSGTPSLGAASAAELQKLNIEEAPAPLDSVRVPMTPPPPHSAPMEGVLETPDHLALAREEAEIADSLMVDDSDYSQNVPSVVLLDVDHVRPGLRVTQEDYDAIKSLILDLLGWGVTVETMLESGVNRHVIYYVFNELNLRLPDNFDLSGILAYTPEFFSQPQSYPAASTTNARSRRTPSPTRINGHRPALQSPVELDLHDRERQRRQELMARKAARVAQQARPIIKTETSDSTSALDMNDDKSEDVVMGPAAAPAETVDDFLNSLGSVQELQSASSSNSREASAPQSAMDIDTDLENGQVIEYTPHSASLSASTTSDNSNGTFRFSEPPPSSSEPPPTSVDSASTTFSRISDMSNEDLISPPTAQIIPPKMVRASIRRPTNRPVASDFVDFHGESSRLPPSATNLDNRNGRAAGASITRPLRKNTSFSRVGNARRCVIDISDSEEEHAAAHAQPRMPIPSLADQRRDSSRQVWNGRSAAPPMSKPVTPSVSPAILEQKELEIKKMREMIALREEETRQKKLAMAKPTTGFDLTPQPITPTQTFVVPKQEEPEITDIPPVVETEVAMEVDNAPDVPPSPSSVASTPPATRSELPHEDLSAAITHQEPLVPQPNGDVVQDIKEQSIPTQPDVLHPDTPGFPQAANLTQTQASSDNPQKSAALHSPSVQQSVDADVSMSTSTQVNGNTTTPLLPAPQQTLLEQDGKSPPFSSSTLKNEPDAQFDKFSSYHSLFESYPGLFHRPEKALDSSLFSRDSSSSILSSEPSSLSFYSDLHSSGLESFVSSAITVPKSLVPLLDLKPLRLLASAKLFNPASRICQFEIPGGGVCRDSKCTDIHLSRFAGMDGRVDVKPSDRDTAQYLFDVLPRSWLTASGIASPKSILQALQQIDQKASGVSLSFDDRVTRALLSLKPRPMT